MRHAKVTGFDKPSSGFSLLGVMFFIPRLIFKVLKLALPFLIPILLIGLFLLPKTPHLRMQYTYSGSDTNRYYIQCYYLGKNGFVQKVLSEGCPIIAFIENEAD